MSGVAVGKNKNTESEYHQRKDNFFRFGDGSQLLHFNGTFGFGGEQFHHRGLNNGTSAM